MKDSKEDKNILRTASSFEEVLIQQHKEASLEKKNTPTEKEVDHLFHVKNPADYDLVGSKIVELLIKS